ncbi:Uncharacterised protein [Vibrio cholerae]|nr:Uncharacterised protein [Vibrio cholerae]CSB85721.1 Uncharacterised protein [Vibrio cholerae]
MLSVNWANNLSFRKILVVVFNKIAWATEACDHFAKTLGGLAVIQHCLQFLTRLRGIFG